MEYNYNNELYHHGVLGMKWGIRRYRYKDGTLTSAGRRKAAKMKEQYTALTGKRLIRKPTPKNIQNQNKSIKNMTDEELDSKIIRLQKESQLYSLQRNSASKGRKFVSTVGRKVIAPAAIDAGKKVLTQLFTKIGKEALKINTNKSNKSNKSKNTNKSMFNELEQEIKALEIKNRKLKAEKEYQHLLSEANNKKRKKNTKYSDGLLDDLLK